MIHNLVLQFNASGKNRLLNLGMSSAYHNFVVCFVSAWCSWKYNSSQRFFAFQWLRFIKIRNDEPTKSRKSNQFQL